MRLTKTEIDATTYSSSNGFRDVRWDDEVSGLGLRVYPSGKKSFVLSYRSGLRKRMMTLGQYGSLTLDQARKLARIKIAEIIQGGDPLLVKRSLVRTGSFGELCSAYMEQHSKIHKKSWKEDLRRIQSHLLPAFKNFPASKLSVGDMTQLHSSIGANSIYEANRTLDLVRALLEKGRIWGFIPMDAYNVAKGVQRFKEKKRDRWITHEELPRVITAIAEEKDLYVRAAIWLYLLTGVRKNELLQAKWTDIDFQRGELKLHNTKAGNDFYSPLSSAALQLLENLPREIGNPYVIPGKNPGSRRININKPWDRIRKRAGVEDVRIHDLRRTVGSYLAQTGMSLHLIGRLLNHASTETTKVYARFGQDSLRAAIESHGSTLLERSLTPKVD